MPIETKPVLSCGNCDADKAEANGWYIVFTSPKSITVRPVHVTENYKDLSADPNADAACGRGCAIQMVSKALAELKHEAKVGDQDMPRRWRKKAAP
jgi:hypothetical protein